MARLLLPTIILYSLHPLFVQAPLVRNPLRSLFSAGQSNVPGQRIEELGASRPVEPSTGPSSRTENWDSSRTDRKFHGKCERFRKTLRSAHLRRDNLNETVVIRRRKIFDDTFKKTSGFNTQRFRRPWLIEFKDEPGYGIGVKREWYTALIRSTVDRQVQLFVPSDGDRDAYTINRHKSASAETLQRFRFIGRIVAKAVVDGQQLPMYFTRSMYKHILGNQVDCTDLKIEDPVYYRSLKFIRENDVGRIEQALRQSLKWSVEVVEGGKTVERELRPRGRNIEVSNDERKDYVQRVCEMKLHTVIEKQLEMFLTGFYEIIPKTMISIFNEHELELVISGPPVIDIDDWQANTEYDGYDADSQTIEWFWACLRSFTQEQLGRFLHYVTGSSKPPLQGFAYLNDNAGAYRKFKITKGRMLKASVCSYELILPSYFETEEDLKLVLLTIIESFSDGFNRS